MSLDGSLLGSLFWMDLPWSKVLAFALPFAWMFRDGSGWINGDRINLLVTYLINGGFVWGERTH